MKAGTQYAQNREHGHEENGDGDHHFNQGEGDRGCAAFGGKSRRQPHRRSFTTGRAAMVSRSISIMEPMECRTMVNSSLVPLGKKWTVAWSKPLDSIKLTPSVSIATSWGSWTVSK